MSQECATHSLICEWMGFQFFGVYLVSRGLVIDITFMIFLLSKDSFIPVASFLMQRIRILLLRFKS